MGILYIPADEVVVAPVYAWTDPTSIPPQQTEAALHLASVYIAPRVDWSTVLETASSLRTTQDCTTAILTISGEQNIRTGVVRDFLIRAGVIEFDFDAWAVRAAAAIGKAGEIQT